MSKLFVDELANRFGDGGIIFTGLSTVRDQMVVGSASTTANLYVVGNAAQSVIGLGTQTGTVILDFSTGNNFSFTAVGNITLANPIGITTGQTGAVFITQDGTGSRTVAFGGYWKFKSATAPTLSTGANEQDVLGYIVKSSTQVATGALVGLGTT